eukprot:3344482-Amphidinium_carterae.1
MLEVIQKEHEWLRNEIFLPWMQQSEDKLTALLQHMRRLKAMLKAEAGFEPTNRGQELLIQSRATVQHYFPVRRHQERLLAQSHGGGGRQSYLSSGQSAREEYIGAP